MMFPELRERLNGLKRFLPDLGSQAMELNLKSEEFTPANVGQVAAGNPSLHWLLGGGGPSWSGESVNINSALNHSVVWACTRVIAEPVGFMPAIVMREKANEKAEATDLPMYGAMKHAPNDELTSQTFLETLTMHCVLGGNGYAQIIRRSGRNRTALALNPLLPEMVMVERDAQKRLVYVVREPRQSDRFYTVKTGEPQDIFHLRGLGWNGFTGFSVITLGRQSIGSAIATERNVGRFWARGGRVPYILENPKRFRSDEDFEDFRKKWEVIESDPHRTQITQDGLTYKQIGLSMVDAQALETRQFTATEMCRWFGVSPHLVADLSRATFSNIEQLWLEYKTLTLNRWITRWEKEFWRCVLTPDEKGGGVYLKLNVDAILRADFAARMAGYATALQNGFKNIDEVRDLEDDNPLPDGAGQDYHIQLNMQTVQSADAGGAPKQQGGGLIKLTGRSAA